MFIDRIVDVPVVLKKTEYPDKVSDVTEVMQMLQPTRMKGNREGSSGAVPERDESARDHAKTGSDDPGGGERSGVRLEDEQSRGAAQQS